MTHSSQAGLASIRHTIPDTRPQQWHELQTALGHLTRAEVQVRYGDEEAALMLLGDVRACLGALALLLADGPQASGYAKLLENVITEPRVNGHAR